MNTFHVARLPAEKLQKLKPLLGKVVQKPYRFLSDDLRNGLDNYWFGEISEALKNGHGEVFVGLNEDKITGVVIYIDLPWETRILQKKMGAIKYFLVDHDFPQKNQLAEYLLDQVLDWAISSDIEFLLCKAYTNDILAIHALETKGFLLMDTLLDYVYDFRKYPLKDISKPFLPSDVMLRFARQDDESTLITIAQKAFGEHFGRFHADEKILPSQATQIYKEWIKSSIMGYADYVLVAEVRDQIAGFSVWKKPSSLEQNAGIQMGHYSICGIHPDYQGKGLFGILTWEGMNLLNNQALWIEGPTHINNYPVQRGYTKLSWRICDARHSFHKWIKDS